MAQLQATLTPLKPEGGVSEEIGVQATLRNASDRPILVNRARLASASLALEIRDAKGEVVPLPPPPVPNEALRLPGDGLLPGASITFEYSNFLGHGQEPGKYTVRYKPAISGEATLAPASASASESCEIVLTKPTRVVPQGTPVTIAPSTAASVSDRYEALRHAIACAVRKLRGIKCDRVLDMDVDQVVTETISNAPPGSEAWNGNYRWHSRFHLRVEEVACRATVTVRVRLIGGPITFAQKTAIEIAIQKKWNGKFKLCCRCCCCRNGYWIVTDIQFVDAGEHQTVSIIPWTADMGHWSASDTTDVGHEFGHMLGARDEYFTVDGTDYGDGRQPTGAIMNNPENDPADRNYDVIRDAARTMLATTCRTIDRNKLC